MEFPNTLFPLIFLAQLSLMKSTDCSLHWHQPSKNPNCRLGHNFFDAMKAVAFLLLLERSRLQRVNAVDKLFFFYWHNDLVDMLADQVVVLLEWPKNPTLVCGGISLIEELCDREVNFVGLHQRRDSKFLRRWLRSWGRCVKGSFREWVWSRARIWKWSWICCWTFSRSSASLAL